MLIMSFILVYFIINKYILLYPFMLVLFALIMLIISKLFAINVKVDTNYLLIYNAILFVITAGLL